MRLWKFESFLFVFQFPGFSSIDHPTSFCVSGSTAFLLGPAQQLGMMVDPVRVFATAIYLGCVVIALICALWVSPTPLSLQAPYITYLLFEYTNNLHFLMFPSVANYKK